MRLTHGEESKQGVWECVERVRGEKMSVVRRAGRAEVTRDGGKGKCVHTATGRVRVLKLRSLLT